MKTFREFVEANQDKPVERIAILALKLPAEILLPVLTHEVDLILRTLARTSERSVILPALERLKKTASARIPEASADLIAALRQRVALGNGERIPMLDMTTQQHWERITFLRSQRDGIDQTIKLHEECITLLQRKHVVTMRELLERKKAA